MRYPKSGSPADSNLDVAQAATVITFLLLTVGCVVFSPTQDITKLLVGALFCRVGEILAVVAKSYR